MSQKKEQRRRGNSREKILKAALKLSIERRSFSAVGLREIAREAGLHHTTFYLHFDSMEEVAAALVEPLTYNLRMELTEARRNAFGDPCNVIKSSIDRYFSYIAEHPKGVVFCIRELHGDLPVVRDMVRGVIESFRKDMEEDLRNGNVFPQLEQHNLLPEVTRIINDYAFNAAIDYVEFVGDRELIRSRTVHLIDWVVSGATAQLPVSGRAPKKKKLKSA